MPANPERMRPTALSSATIVQEVNVIVLEEAIRIKKDSQRIFKSTLFTAAQRFIANSLLDKKE